MALEKRGKNWYGSEVGDMHGEIRRYSKRNGYTASKFAEPVCACGCRTFSLESDDEAGVARRTCASCGAIHLIGDSAEYLEGAELEEHECLCGGNRFQLSIGAALYEGSNDVRWSYIGCLCDKCCLVGVFSDWKCEGGEAETFLAKA